VLEETYVSEYPYSPAVIATGGSVVYGPRAMARLKALGPVIFLDVDIQTLEHRLGDLDARGVAREPNQTLAELLIERSPLYQRYADIAVPAGEGSAEVVTHRVMDALPSFHGL
jgi:shikimate kinase